MLGITRQARPNRAAPRKQKAPEFAAGPPQASRCTPPESRRRPSRSGPEYRIAERWPGRIRHERALLRGRSARLAPFRPIGNRHRPVAALQSWRAVPGRPSDRRLAMPSAIRLSVTSFRVCKAGRKTARRTGKAPSPPGRLRWKPEIPDPGYPKTGLWLAPVRNRN